MPVLFALPCSILTRTLNDFHDRRRLYLTNFVSLWLILCSYIIRYLGSIYPLPLANLRLITANVSRSSSVVERTLGKGEVGSSILPCGTI